MLFLLGGISGFINGLFGAGAGLIILPGLVAVLGMDGKKARGTTLLVLLTVSCITLIFYVGNMVDYLTLWYIIAGGIFGGTIGSRWIKNVSEKKLQLVLGIIMIITGVRMLI